MPPTTTADQLDIRYLQRLGAFSRDGSFKTLPVQCPAAVQCGSAGHVCGIEGVPIRPGADPSTYYGRCTRPGGYVGCPTWRVKKEQEWRAKDPVGAAGYEH